MDQSTEGGDTPDVDQIAQIGEAIEELEQADLRALSEESLVELWRLLSEIEEIADALYPQAVEESLARTAPQDEGVHERLGVAELDEELDAPDLAQESKAAIVAILEHRGIDPETILDIDAGSLSELAAREDLDENAFLDDEVTTEYVSE